MKIFAALFPAALLLAAQPGVAAPQPDNDADGVPDSADVCPHTPPGAIVDAQGCATDEDFDGVPDGVDLCPHSDFGTAVDGNGCAAGQQATRAPAVPAAPPAAAVTMPAPAPAAMPAPPAAPPPAAVPVAPAPVAAAPVAPASPVAAPVVPPVYNPSLEAISARQQQISEGAAMPKATVALADRDPRLFSEVVFAQGKSDFSEADVTTLRDALPQLTDLMQRSPRLRLLVIGHADPATEHGAADKLAAARALAVHAWLIRNGISPKHSTRSSQADGKPLVLRGDSARNRRVEILVVSD